VPFLQNRTLNTISGPGNSMNQRAPVLLLGMSATGLGALRLLGRAGVTCYGVDDHGRTPAYWSRYCRHGICLPAGADDDDIMKVLDDFSTRAPIPPVLLPTSDRFVRFVSSRREQLDSRYQLLLPDHELVEDLLDKQRFAQCAQVGGAAVPRSVALRGLGELPSLTGHLALPIILKPACTEHRSEFVIPKVILLEREEEFAATLDRYSACNGVPFLAQEYIPGGDRQHLSVAVCLDRRSEVVATFTARKNRQGNLGAGVGTYVERFQDAEAEQSATALLRSLKYVGVAEVEFKRHAHTGRLYVIEVNPRVWTQVALPGACGLNYPLMFYCLATGLPLPTAQVTQRRIAWQSLWDDFYNTFRRGGYREAGMVSRWQWLRQTAQAHVGPFWDLRDPLPALVQLWQVARQVVRRPARRGLDRKRSVR